MLWLRKYQVLSRGQIIVGVILVWTWQFWSHPVTLASVIFIFHLKVIVVVNSCCCLVRILYLYSSHIKLFFKVLEKFKDRWVRREGFGEWYDGGKLIHLLFLLSIEQPRTWTSLPASDPPQKRVKEKRWTALPNYKLLYTLSSFISYKFIAM